tara:strand:+ start:623 stop:763 length:141 start_codon:yes stop_codon:yes gene_type:complete
MECVYRVNTAFTGKNNYIVFFISIIEQKKLYKKKALSVFNRAFKSF